MGKNWRKSSLLITLLNLIERQVPKPPFGKGKTIIQLSQIVIFTINIESL